MRGSIATLLLLVAACDQKTGGGDAVEEEVDGPPPTVLSVTGTTADGEVEIPDGGSFRIPGDDDTASTPIFTAAMEAFSIRNLSDDPIIVDRIIIDTPPGIMDEELTLVEDAPGTPPLVVEDVEVPSGSAFEFHVRFFPVRGADREADVTITYETTRTHSFTVTGAGDPADASFFTNGGPALHRVIGTPTTGDTVAGMAVSEEGDSYISGFATGIFEATADDLMIVHLAPDGTYAWGKAWHASYRDHIPPTGSGPEGGSPGCMGIDDAHVYLAAATNESPGSPDSGERALVLCLDRMTGDLSWNRLWTPVPAPSAPSDASSALALDVDATHVYVAGTTGAAIGSERSHAFLVALDTEGSGTLFELALDLAVAGDDVAHAVRVLGTDALLAGETDSRGFVLKLSAVDTSAPALAWAKLVDMGAGATVNGMEVGSTGDVYLSTDREGLHFTVLKLSGADGSLLWGKTYTHGSSTPRNQSHALLASTTDVYAGGIVALDDWDAALGDALLLDLDPSTGSLVWAAVYFTGTDSGLACTHRVKRIAAASDTLYLAGQTYTGSDNVSRYHGYWYDAPEALEDYVPTVTDLVPDLLPVAGGELSDPTGAFDDLPVEVTVQNAWSKTYGSPPDEDIFWQTIFI